MIRLFQGKSSGSCSSKGKDRELALLRGDLMLAQAAAHGAYHAAVAAAAKGKVITQIYFVFLYVSRMIGKRLLTFS